MRNAIIKSAKIGALTGLMLSLLYAIIFLISIETYLPVYNPSIIFIFTLKSLRETLSTLLYFSPVWLIIPTIFGGIISAIFTLILLKIKPTKMNFLAICELICVFFISPLLFNYIATLVGIHMHWGYPGFLSFGLHLGLNLFVQIDLLLLYPSIICLVAGIFVGNSLYNQFYSYVKATSP